MEFSDFLCSNLSILSECVDRLGYLSVGLTTGHVAPEVLENEFAKMLVSISNIVNLLGKYADNGREM